MLGLILLFIAAFAVVVAIGTLAGLHFLTHPRRITFATMVARNMPTSPKELGFEFEDLTLTGDKGLVIPAWRVDGRDPDGPVVVMTHGWSDSRYGMLTPLQAIGPVASQVWMYDLRGQGESPAPASHLGTTEVHDLLQILREIARRAPGKPVVLVGFSMGAGISIAAAAHAQRSPDGLPSIVGVLGDGAYRLGMQPIEGYMRLNNLPRQPFLFLMTRHLSFWYSSDAAFDRAGHARHVQCPILLLHGENDVVCPLHAAHDIAAAAPQARLEVFTGAGHMDLYATDPDRYESLVAGFITQTAPRPAPSPGAELTAS